jgi:hypothetical protein
VLERNVPGNSCLFYCFPYDAFTDTMVNYLRARRWIGARAGQFHAAGLNPPSLPDPFRPQFLSYGSGDSVAGLNAHVAGAVSRGGWALREMHNVGPGGGYAMDPDTFAAHLDYCRSEADQGRLWMAPVQEVIMYAKERGAYTVAIGAQTDSTLTIAFTTDLTEINPSPMVDNTLYDYPLTLLVTPPAGAAVTGVVQGSDTLAWTLASGRARFDARPYAGPVTVRLVRSAAAERATTPVRAAPRREGGRYLLDGRCVAPGSRPNRRLRSRCRALAGW